MSHRTQRNVIAALTALALTSVSAALTAQQAAPNEFRATVYGMVCNQCAYGVEQSLQHTDGVTDALVDLRNGSVVVKAGESPPAARAVVKKIRDQGVSVRKLEATLTGRVEKAGEGWELVVGGHRFLLEAGAGSPDLSPHAGETVSVVGTFEGVEGVDDAAGAVRFVPSKFAG